MVKTHSQGRGDVVRIPGWGITSNVLMQCGLKMNWKKNELEYRKYDMINIQRELGD